ncbi:MAG: histone deacetylase, partial [Solirubrobacterales bacterium]|nr:histone deacetylase [Solirubrobacterales bacterium]
MPPPILLSHPDSLRHDPGPHPDAPERMEAIERELAARGGLGYERRESPEVKRSVLEAVHPPQYLDWLEALSARGGGMIDGDTIASAGSWGAALH